VLPSRAAGPAGAELELGHGDDVAHRKNISPYQSAGRLPSGPTGALVLVRP
jgi:hypothetical protein